jgi:hypothetical protein
MATSNRNQKIKIPSIVICVIVLGPSLAAVVHGRPSYATSHNNNCSDCHTNGVTGRMEVTGEDSLLDLGTQLDGKIRGPLKTFKAVPGGVVTLSVRVLDGNDRFAVQLKDFEKPARRYSPNNLLLWSPANASDNIWTRQQVGNPPYFTKDNGANGGMPGSLSPATYTFDLLVESGTPLDVYELVFAVPGLRGGVRVYQEEHFYLEVTAATQFDFNGDGLVDINDLLRVIDSWGQDVPAVDIAPPPFGDGVVDVRDLELLMSYWGQSYADPTLMAHWALDEAQGDTALNQAGTGDGVVVGGPIWQPGGGQSAGALQLDGVDDCITTEPVFSPTAGPFSLFAWVKGGAPGQAILSQAGGADWLAADTVQGALRTDLRQPKVGRLPEGPPLISPVAITDGFWHRVGFTWDGTNRVLYVDGVEVARDTQTGLAASTGGLYLGAGSLLAPGTYWAGLIDDVRIYSRVVRP